MLIILYCKKIADDTEMSISGKEGKEKVKGG